LAEHRAELERLAGPIGGLAEDYANAMYRVEADARQMAELGIIDVVRDPAGCRKLLGVYRRVEGGVGRDGEEKGYLDAACADGIPEASSLDGIDAEAILEGHGIAEGWRKRRIDERWVVYVRQYEMRFLH